MRWWRNLVRWVVHGKDYERALALEVVARGCAAYVVSIGPATTKWAHLVEQTVKHIASISGKPTTSMAAIQRAAIAALLALGKDPSR